MEPFRHLGLALEILRSIAHRSQAELARSARCGKAQISKYERGRELPKLETLARILEALNVSPLTLFFLVAVLDGLEEAPDPRALPESLIRAVLPAFGQEEEDAMGKLLAGLFRSYLSAQERRLVAEARRFRTGDPAEEPDRL